MLLRTSVEKKLTASRDHYQMSPVHREISRAEFLKRLLDSFHADFQLKNNFDGKEISLKMFICIIVSLHYFEIFHFVRTWNMRVWWWEKKQNTSTSLGHSLCHLEKTFSFYFFPSIGTHIFLRKFIQIIFFLQKKKIYIYITKLLEYRFLVFFFLYKNFIYY